MSEELCSNCKKTIKPKRIDGHYIIHEIEHVLHFERGILYTIRELSVNPGDNIKNFITENRSRLVKPVIFLIIASLIYTLINKFFHVDEAHIQYNDAKESQIRAVISLIQSHYGYSNIIIGGFIAFWLKIFFRKYDYNFFEILILMCFILGMEMLLFSVFVLLEELIKTPLGYIALIINFIYLTWAVGQFFDKTKAISYVKTFISYLLGLATFAVFIAITVVLTDLFIKN